MAPCLSGLHFVAGRFQTPATKTPVYEKMLGDCSVSADATSAEEGYM